MGMKLNFPHISEGSRPLQFQSFSRGDLMFLGICLILSWYIIDKLDKTAPPPAKHISSAQDPSIWESPHVSSSQSTGP